MGAIYIGYIDKVSMNFTQYADLQFLLTAWSFENDRIHINIGPLPCLTIIFFEIMPYYYYLTQAASNSLLNATAPLHVVCKLCLARLLRDLLNAMTT